MKYLLEEAKQMRKVNDSDNSLSIELEAST